MQPLRFVLWDNDGVLVDTEEGYFLATQRALARCGVRLERARYHELRARGHSAWETPEVRELGRAIIDRHRAIRDEDYQRFIAGASLEIAGVRTVLDTLARRYRMGIVTTCKRRDFDVLHREQWLTRFMEFVLTREDFVREKPAPDGYLAALDRFGAKAGEAIVIEDSAQGLNAARAAGLRCVIVRNRFFGDAHAFEGAAEVIESIDALPGVIAKLSGEA